VTELKLRPHIRFLDSRHVQNCSRRPTYLSSRRLPRPADDFGWRQWQRIANRLDRRGWNFRAREHGETGLLVASRVPRRWAPRSSNWCMTRGAQFRWASRSSSSRTGIRRSSRTPGTRNSIGICARELSMTNARLRVALVGCGQIATPLGEIRKLPRADWSRSAIASEIWQLSGCRFEVAPHLR